jgi:integrase
MRITQQSVKKLVTGKPIAKIEWDEELRGFGRRRTEAGTITYVLSYYFKGKNHRITIGNAAVWSVEAARKEAKRLQVEVDKGHDPVAERHAWKSEPNLKELATAYLKDATTRKRDSSLGDDRRMLGVNEDGTTKDDGDEAQRKKRILTVLGEHRLAEIKQSDIALFHESLRPTPYQANRALALLSAIFNYGIKHKWGIVENPAKGITKFKEEKRERWLTVEEIQKFREALDKYRDQSAANVLRLLLLTGSRASEALKATWEEFDLQRGVWTKPSHHTKQDKREHVPLSAQASKLLEDMAPENAAGPLFPGRALKGKSRTARVSLKRPWVAACRAAGLVEEYLIDGKRKGKDGELVKLKRYRPTVRVHDLRHNFASHLASNGVSLQVVGKLLGHTQASTTMRYAHLQDAPLRDAANQFGRIFEQAPKAGKRRT